jgi:hypothetical protein
LVSKGQGKSSTFFDFSKQEKEAEQKVLKIINGLE